MLPLLKCRLFGARERFTASGRAGTCLPSMSHCIASACRIFKKSTRQNMLPLPWLSCLPECGSTGPAQADHDLGCPVRPCSCCRPLYARLRRHIHALNGVRGTTLTQTLTRCTHLPAGCDRRLEHHLIIGLLRALCELRAVPGRFEEQRHAALPEVGRDLVDVRLRCRADGEVILPDPS
jgi:hypothetical protein